MIEITDLMLHALLACCVVDADERAICEGCGKSAYIHARHEGELTALRAIVHDDQCYVGQALRLLDKDKNPDAHTL